MRRYHDDDKNARLLREWSCPVRAQAGVEAPVSIEQWDTAIGTSGLSNRRGLVYSGSDMHPFKLRGLYCPGVLDEQRTKDPVIAAAYKSVTGTIQQGNPAFMPTGGEGDSDWDLQQLVSDYWDWLLDAMGGGVRGLWELAASYPYYGFQLAEPVLRMTDSPFGQVLAIARLEPRLPRSISSWIYHTDGPDRGQLAGVAQGRQLLRPERIIPIERLIHWCNGEAQSGPEGEAFGRPIHFPWRAKQDVLVGDAGVTARWKYGVPQFEPATGVTEQKYDTKIRAQIKSAMRKYVSKLNGFLMPPFGYIFRVAFPTSSAPDPRIRVEMLDKQILYAIHALWLDPANPGTGKSNDSHQNNFRGNVNHFATSIIETMSGPEERPGSGLLRKLARYNFPIPAGFHWPAAKVGGITHRDVELKLKNVMLLLQSGGLGWSDALEKWLLEELGAPPSVIMGANGGIIPTVPGDVPAEDPERMAA